MRVGLVTSGILHAVVLTWGMIALHAPDAFDVPDVQSLPVELVTLAEITQGQKGLVRQIAGLIARRIVTYPEEGEQITRGDRIGLIRFGSRVDLFLPLDWPLTCSVGDKAIGFSTVFARINGQEDAS